MARATFRASAIVIGIVLMMPVLIPAAAFAQWAD